MPLDHGCCSRGDCASDPTNSSDNLWQRAKRECDTQGSHVITHRSTNWACWCLTSQIGRDGVLSPEYGRIRWAWCCSRPGFCRPDKSSSLHHSACKHDSSACPLMSLGYNLVSPMAQSVARQAVNLQVAGSNPAGGDFAAMEEQSGAVVSAVGS